jgi:hypothetical protein
MKKAADDYIRGVSFEKGVGVSIILTIQRKDPQNQ